MNSTPTVETLYKKLDALLEHYELTYDTKNLNKQLTYFINGLNSTINHPFTNKEKLQNAINGLRSVNEDSNIFDILDALRAAHDYFEMLIWHDDGCNDLP